MSKSKEERWVYIDQIEIPEIKSPGFESHVLERKIWEKAPEAPDTPKTPAALPEVMPDPQIEATEIISEELEATEIISEVVAPAPAAAPRPALRPKPMPRRKQILLTRMSTGRQLVIDVGDDPFTIGKSRKADLTIDGNPSISRIHAVIYRAGENYYLEDQGSLNHTYVDEEVITGPYKLRNGLVVRFADEDFILRMH